MSVGSFSICLCMLVAVATWTQTNCQSNGETGATGATGIDGAQGFTGRPGPVGQAGIPGNNGNDGPRGLQGRAGLRGIIGIQGYAGWTGQPGNAGSTGQLGPAGGPPGPPGAPGKPGVSGPAIGNEEIARMINEKIQNLLGNLSLNTDLVRFIDAKIKFALTGLNQHASPNTYPSSTPNLRQGQQANQLDRKINDAIRLLEEAINMNNDG